MNRNKGLLIIDMQKGCFIEAPRYDTDGVVARINALARIFRDHGLPVVFIQHDGTKTGEYLPGTTEWALLDALEVEPNDIMIGKYANDVFYRSDLQSRLEELDVEELFITGCATDFCVEATVQSALAKDYRVTVVADGHTTADRPHLPAEKVIEHYNWIWQRMIPTEGSVAVKKVEEIEGEMEVLAKVSNT